MDESSAPRWAGPFVGIQRRFERGFARFRDAYGAMLAVCLEHRLACAAGFLAFCAGSWLLVGQLGEDFFPTVDAGQFRLHVRAPTGRRIEETARLVDQIVAFQIPLGRLEGKWKLNQNHPLARRQRVIAALRKRPDEASQEIAGMMEERMK